MKSYDEIVSENIQYYMRMNNFTTRSLAEKAGTTSMSISNWSRGLHVPKPHKLDGLCKAFNITVEELTTDRDAIPNLSVPAAYPVPMIGTICAGDGILGEQNYDGYFFVDNSIRADYCLRVEGDSMKDANINHGDIAFLRKSFDFLDGRIYAIVFGESKNAVLKRVYRQNEGLLLVPCNDAYKPIYVDSEYIVCGELVGVYHSV